MELESAVYVKVLWCTSFCVVVSSPMFSQYKSLAVFVGQSTSVTLDVFFQGGIVPIEAK